MGGGSEASTSAFASASVPLSSLSFQHGEVTALAVLPSAASSAGQQQEAQVVTATAQGVLSVHAVHAGSVRLVAQSRAKAQSNVSQLAVLPFPAGAASKGTHGLVVLAQGDLALYSLPELDLVSSFAPQSKAACSAFFVNTTGGDDDDDAGTVLLAACRRRLVLLRWDQDGGWITPLELALPHQIRSLDFLPLPAATAALGKGKGKARQAVAGFSTGDYGVVTLPTMLPSAGPQAMTLSDLFSPLETASSPSEDNEADGAAGYAGTWGKASLMGLGALARAAKGGKMDRNGVVVTSTAGEQPGENKVRAWGFKQHASTLSLPSNSSSTASLTLQLPPHSHAYQMEHLLSLGPYLVALFTPSSDLVSPVAVASGVGGAPEPKVGVYDLAAASAPGAGTGDGRPERLPLVQLLSPLGSGAAATASHLQPLGATSFIFLLTSKPSPPSGIAPAATSQQAQQQGEQHLVLCRLQPWERQIAELGAKGEWVRAWRRVRAATGAHALEEATALKLDKLRALDLFQRGKWRDAVDQLLKLEITPAKVVGLFDAKVSGRLEMRSPREREAVFGGREATAEDFAVEPGKEGEQLVGDDWEKALEEFVRYLTDRRQKYSQALASLLPSSRPSPYAARPAPSRASLLALPDVALTQLKPDELARVAETTDTALFKAYLNGGRRREGLLGPLCRIENWCRVEEVEELLLDKKKYKELLDLYNGRSLHSAALALLRRTSDTLATADERAEPTVRYLHKLGPAHLKLIFDEARWVFGISKEKGMEIFLADLEEVESLPRHEVAEFLAGIGEQGAAKEGGEEAERYLEHLVGVLGEQGEEFTERLIGIYLAGKGTDPAAQYQKLLKLLATSHSYRPDRVLARLPPSAMFEARALLLGRLGRHEGALQLYVYQLNDEGSAEAYCERVYSSPLALTAGGQPSEKDRKEKEQIFLTLLRIYLRPRPSYPLLFGPALKLLAKHAASIDPIEVFELLPPLAALGDIELFLRKTLRASVQRRRETEVLKGIARSGMDSASMRVVELQERHVRITDGRLCPQCFKRIGNSVIAVHYTPSATGADGDEQEEVTHYHCSALFQQGKRDRRQTFSHSIKLDQ